ncbi:unnamed protein product [Rhizopus stolonifer]
MVSFKVFTIAALLTAIAEAAISPSYPQPGTIQVQGQSYDITWSFDGKNPSQTYQIDFMTGNNDDQKVLKTVAKGVSASLLKYPFIAPEVSPNSAIYFFMFTGSEGDQAWTTRFGITPDANTKLTTEPQTTQPNGDKIPWGIGKLVSSSNSTSSASSAVPVAAVSSSPVVVSSVTASSDISSSAAPSAAAAAVSSADASSSAAGDVSAPAGSAFSAKASSSVASIKASTETSAGMIVKPTLSLLAAGLTGYLFF